MPFVLGILDLNHPLTAFRSALLEMLDEGFKSSSQVGGFPLQWGWTPSPCHAMGFGVWLRVVLVDILWRYLGEIILQLQSPLDISLVICLPFLDAMGSDHFC